MSGFPKKVHVVFRMALVIAILTSSCSVLPANVQKELEQQTQNEIDKALETFKDWLEDSTEEIVDDATEQVNETLNDAIKSIGDFLGINVPDLVGKLAIGIQTSTKPTDLKTLFQEAYKKAGGNNAIGLPEDYVRLATSGTKKILYQYFKGGSQTRSLMLLEDGQKLVYLIPGQWLKTYEGMGGLKTAFPTSNIQDYDADWWRLWGKDQIQYYNMTAGKEFVLMKPGDVNQVMVVPPLFWDYYETHDGKSVFGAPLSSFPLDETQAVAALSKTSQFTEVISTWRTTSNRLQVFEKAALVFNKSVSTYDIIQKQNLLGGEIHLPYTVGPILLREKNNVNVLGNTCFVETITTAGVVATTEGSLKVFLLIPKMMVLATATIGSWTAESLGTKLFFDLTKLVVAALSNENMIFESGKLIAGRVLESLYAKVIGDVLAGPASDVTTTVIESAYEKLQSGRISYISQTASGNVQVSINYDPWTHFAWGVATNNTCNPQGYLFVMELMPSGFYVENSGHYYDLSRQGIEVR